MRWVFRLTVALLFWTSTLNNVMWALDDPSALISTFWAASAVFMALGGIVVLVKGVE